MRSGSAGRATAMKPRLTRNTPMQPSSRNRASSCTAAPRSADGGGDVLRHHLGVPAQLAVHVRLLLEEVVHLRAARRGDGALEEEREPLLRAPLPGALREVAEEREVEDERRREDGVAALEVDPDRH